MTTKTKTPKKPAKKPAPRRPKKQEKWPYDEPPAPPKTEPLKFD
jgi:hypothetical protein